MKRVLLGPLCACALSALVSGCGDGQDGAKDQKAEPGAEAAEPQAAEAGAVKAEAVDTESGKTLEVELPYGVKLTFVWVGPGSFTMGSPAEEAGRDEGETPHKVTLSHGFWIGRTEVSQREYMAVMEMNPSKVKGADLPVENVFYEDCTAFVRKANKLPELVSAGVVLRLPTEAEWEFAAKGGPRGGAGPYAGGADVGAVAWYGANSGDREISGDWTLEAVKENRGRTHKVAGKAPNALGLFDMSGNVREWCSDLYHDYPISGVVDPIGGPRGDMRIVRGGSWFDRAADCRSSARAWMSVCREGFIGFRLAADTER